MGSSTRRWSREELEEAFQRYQRAVIEVGKTWDWSGYADHFTEDAKYVEHAMGNMEGRENIREWIVSTMNTFPAARCRFTRWSGTRSTPTRAGSSSRTSTR
jgi:ketosteroid isomerase-like protein